MSSGAAQAWFIAGTIPLTFAGGLHRVATVLDVARPTFFTPIGDSVRARMEGGGMQFRALPAGDAATPFGLLCLPIGTHDFALVQNIGGLQALAIAVPTAYLAISLFFWFYVPALAAACLIMAAVLA